MQMLGNRSRSEQIGTGVGTVLRTICVAVGLWHIVKASPQFITAVWEFIKAIFV